MSAGAPPLIVFLDRGSIRSDVALPSISSPHRWVEHDHTRPDEVVDRLAGATVAITNKVPITAETLAALPGLKLIAVAATGTDNIDKAAAAERGVEMRNVADYGAQTVAEHVFALTLALQRKLVPYREAVLSGAWSASKHFCVFPAPIEDIAGRRFGFIGWGSIARRAAAIAEAFGAEAVIAERRGEAAARAGRTPFDEVLATSDILSLHCPLTPETRNLIDGAALARMKPGALLINTARGPLIDEPALLEALKSGRLGGAGLDVASREPPQPGDPIFEIAAQPNAVVTPHAAWSSGDATRRLLAGVVHNIETFLSGNR